MDVIDQSNSEAQGASTTGDDAQSAPTQQQTVSADEFRSLQEQLADSQKRIKKLSDEAAKYRNAKKEEEAQRIEAARKAGELEPVVADLEARLAELSPIAALGERAQRRLEERIERDSAKLPEDVREKLSRIRDLEERSDALEFYLDAIAAKKTTTPVPGDAPPAGGGASPQSFAGLSGAALLDAAAKDPQAFWQSRNVGGQPRTMIGRAIAAASGKR